MTSWSERVAHWWATRKRSETKLRWASADAGSTEPSDDADGDVSLVVRNSANRSILVAARNIYVQAPAIVIPVLILFAIAVIVGSAAVLSSISQSSPGAPKFSVGSPYVLDLVVMPFRAATPDDPGCRTLASELPNDLTDAIEKHLSNSQADGVASSIKVWSPSQTGMRAEATANAYAEQAERLVGNQGADIALYATVYCDGSQLTVVPRFDIAPTYFRDAPEYQGTYELGSFSSAIRQPSDKVASTEIRRELVSRATAMAILIQGFEYYARHTYTNYLRAIEVFNQIISQTPPPNSQIMAIAHVFAGNASLRAAIGDCGDSLNSDQLDLASVHYQTALTFEPQMALAYLGLGNVMNQRAFYESGTEVSVVREYLRKGEAFMANALLATMQPSAANIAGKVLYGRAQARIIEREFVESATESELLLAEAEALVGELLRMYSAGEIKGTGAQSLAAYAYVMMGNIQMQRFNNEAALADLKEAAALATDARLKSLIALRTAEVQNNLGDLCAAAAEYQIAADNTRCEDDKLDYAMLTRDYQIQCEMVSSGQD